MSRPWKLVDVEPIGTYRTFAHVHRRDAPHTFGDVEMKMYPKGGGETLRDRRVACGVGLRAAAAALGMTAVELSSVERGEKDFASPEDLAVALALIDGGSR